MDESPTTSLPTLPPPLQFQQSNSISNKSQTSNKSNLNNNNTNNNDTTNNLTNVSVINIIPKINSVIDDAKLSSNSSHKDSEMEYDEEYFRTTNEINLNENESFRFERPVETESNENSEDLLSEIKKFNSNNLRPMSKMSDQPLLYEKNIDLLNTPRSSISKNAVPSAIKEEDSSSHASSAPKFNTFDALY